MEIKETSEEVILSIFHLINHKWPLKVNSKELVLEMPMNIFQSTPWDPIKEGKLQSSTSDNRKLN